MRKTSTPNRSRRPRPANRGCASPNSEWKRKLEDLLHRVPGYNPWDQAADAWLDHARAAAAINFFADHLRHIEGAVRGEPFVLRAWQAAIVGNLFGWVRTDDLGRTVRRYRKTLVYVPRGNGKTPLATGIVLDCLFTDHEPGAQIFLAAGRREQAGILFRNARGMIEQDPSLLSIVRIYAGDQHRSIVLKSDQLSFAKVIPADAAGQHGGIPHLTVVDELHVQESRDLLDVFETGMSKTARSQPMLVMITTADYMRESICNEVYEHACQVRDNGGHPDRPGYDPAFLPVIYEAAKEDDWTAESTWERANPNLDVSVSRESLRRECKLAQEIPARENAFRRLHLNLRTEQDVALIPMNAWDNCPSLIERGSLHSRLCYGGLDLASTEDLASFGLLFPTDDGSFSALSFSWCPEDRITRRARQKFPYEIWAKQGHIEATDGDQIDYRLIRRRIVELSREFDIREIGYDPYGAPQIAQDLQEQDGLNVVRIQQSFGSLSAATKQLVGMIKDRTLNHGGNPVLRWAASNAAAHFDGRIPPGQKIEDHMEKVPIMISKRKSTDKVDPIAALVLALVSMGHHPSDADESPYDRHGIQYI